MKRWEDKSVFNSRDSSPKTINRARQYGKTTTLSRLHKTLPDEYICIRISFQGVGEKSFETEEAFCKMFLSHVYDSLQFSLVEDEYKYKWSDPTISDFDMLKRHISKMCKNRKVVLLIRAYIPWRHQREKYIIHDGI